MAHQTAATAVTAPTGSLAARSAAVLGEELPDGVGSVECVRRLRQAEALQRAADTAGPLMAGVSYRDQLNGATVGQPAVSVDTAPAVVEAGGPQLSMARQAALTTGTGDVDARGSVDLH